MESGQDNNYKRVLECFYQSSLPISDFYLSSPFSKQSQVTCINFWIAAFKGKDIRKLLCPSSRRRKGSGSLLIEVACQQEFY